MAAKRKKLQPPDLPAVKHKMRTGATGIKCDSCGERYGTLIHKDFERHRCSTCEGYKRVQPQVFR